jgi:hypothetical protein
MALRHPPPGVGLPALPLPPPPLRVYVPLDAGPLLAAPSRASKQPYLSLQLPSCTVCTLAPYY